MKQAVSDVLLKAMEVDPDVWFLYADLGFRAWDGPESRWPKRCINVGIAEQNAIGVAAGLARCGKRVVVYSIAPFITLRCLEQIRNDLWHPNLDVTLIGAGGNQYRSLGPSHYGDDDVWVMRVLGIPVQLAADARGATVALAECMAKGGLRYIRLGVGDVLGREPPCPI
jgi:transketolase